ncbi:hypothetical protein LNP18_06200 [Leuconostoc citreum]|uniref:hypothetical protein n=1 Tax=Leuconostoc citreum TaxID=33964 RepID=UPI00200AB385|nr:hypothetical protein [Leuconostoc citreum]MCK8605694.1 hypothetical protein [Leuconostoc citreum]
MLLFSLCLLAMFLFWLLGHVIGFVIYIVVLFIGHVMSYWYIYGPLLMIVGLCAWLGVQQLILILILMIIVLSLSILFVTCIQKQKKHD